MVKIFKVILKILFSLAILVVILLFSLGYYLENHKTELFEKIEALYSEKYNGVLSFEDVSISTFKNLPNVTLGLKNLSISDTIYSKNKTETLTIESLQLSVSLRKVLEKDIQIKSIKIINGGVQLLTDSIGHNNHSFFTPKKNSADSAKAKQKNWLSQNGINFTIENFNVSIIDLQKNKRTTAIINKIKSDLQFKDSVVLASVDMEVLMKEMGLNLEKGTFFNDALVSGECNLAFNSKKNLIEIPNFDLSVDEQEFKVKGTINTLGAGTFDFTLVNPKTILNPTVALLSQNIQAKLSSYQVTNPFYTHTNLKGSFAYRDNPVVTISASTKNNTIFVDNTKFNQVTFDSDFINRAYTDERQLTESIKNVRITFNKLRGEFKNIPFKFNKAIYVSIPTARNFIDIDLLVHSKTEVLNNFFESDQFLFLGGAFDFNTTFSGDLDRIEDIYDQTTSSLSFSKTSIRHKPHSTDIPIDTIHIDISKKDAYLTQFIIPIKETNNNIHVSGRLMNAPALIFEGKNALSSELDVYSDALIWEDFIYLFKQQAKNKTKAEKEDDLYLNEALKAIYKKFNPQLKISIKKFQYQNLIVNDLSSGLYFTKADAVDLKRTGFNYRNGAVSMQLQFDISKPNTTSFDIDINANQIDLGSLLKEFDYFGLTSLKEAKKIKGIISFETKMSGDVHEDSGLDTKSLKGTVDLNLTQLEVNGFEPIIKVADKVFKKERFEDIKFAPIQETIYISDRTIEIPQTEIQSTAFDLFVEGHLNYDFKTNIWVSVPLSNIKKRDFLTIPNKKGYAESGKKVYVQVKDDGNGNLDYKFHLNNKILYEEKGILNQYKSSHKDERAIKREYKKQVRKKKKAAKKKNN